MIPSRVVFIVVLCVLVGHIQPVLSETAKLSELRGAYLGQEPPGLKPKVFAPGFVSIDSTHEFSCAFSPDGATFYFARGKGAGNVKEILVTRHTDRGWTVPVSTLPHFEGETFEPRVTPDGRRLFFMGFEPKPGQGMPPINMYCGDLSGDTLIHVEPLDEPFNPMNSMSASFTTNGSIYTTDPRTNGADIAKSALIDGVFQPYENVGAPVNSEHFEVYPFVAPDEHYLIYCRMTKGQGPQSQKLMVSFKQPDGRWGMPKEISLGMPAGTPTVSPDGKYLFFVGGEQRKGDIYWVDFAVVNSAI